METTNNEVLDIGKTNLPEKTPAFASEIYDNVRGELGKAKLWGFGIGVVIYPEKGTKICIDNLGTGEILTDLYRKKGFSDEEIKDGIIGIRECKGNNFEPLVPWADTVRHFFVSRNGRVLEMLNPNKHSEAKLDDIHIDALKRVAFLSKIPRQIGDTFGSYEEFKNELGEKDMAGIEHADFGKNVLTNLPFGDKIIYEGGLREFVRALELQRKGELDGLDTSLHRIRSSLERKDPITQVVETLGKARTYSSSNKPLLPKTS